VVFIYRILFGFPSFNYIFTQSSKFNSPSFGVIGEGKIMAPTAPVSKSDDYYTKTTYDQVRAQVNVNDYRHMPKFYRYKTDSESLTKMHRIVCIWPNWKN